MRDRESETGSWKQRKTKGETGRQTERETRETESERVNPGETGKEAGRRKDRDRSLCYC